MSTPVPHPLVEAVRALAYELEIHGDGPAIDRDLMWSVLQGEAREPSALQQYYLEIRDCQKCPLGRTRTHFVFGVGNEKAEIMFVGEAPGAEEDLQGEPFVGRAGQLLNKMLAEVGLRRQEVYIANVLKCRPPGNRDPLAEEVAQCLPYLRRQIEIIRPKLLVCLGRIAAQALLDVLTPLNRLRGPVWEFHGIPMLVTYHPAAVLRTPSLYEAAIADLRRAVQLHRQIVEREAQGLPGIETQEVPEADKRRKGSDEGPVQAIQETLPLDE
ncbi:MAG: uracil-DNA glycosylase [candidate division KSB1 bacterium]|nr:uracil-DNA glycosylase [candidate division KSB1 bacterium]